MSPSPRRPSKPTPVKPWQRAEAGRYRSSDARFSLVSDGGGRWFVADEEERDELGLARTTGPYPTLDAAKAAADAVRGQPAAASPLASRIADAAGRPRRAHGSAPVDPRSAPVDPGSAPAPRAPADGRAVADREPGGDGPDSSDVASTLPAAAPPTWLGELAEHDAAAAKRATRLIRALEREGVAGADLLVRRDVLGDRPAVAARLLAREVVLAVRALNDPTALTVVEAVAGVLATSKARAGLPGWDLVERGGEGDRRRRIRLTGADLSAAAEDE